MPVAQTTRRARQKRQAQELEANKEKANRLLDPFMEEVMYLQNLRRSDMKIFGQVSPETQIKLDRLQEKILKAKAEAESEKTNGTI